MPLPSPKKKEEKQDFVKRCAVDDENMKKEFPNEKQRWAVCYSLWNKKNEDFKFKVRDYLKEFKVEATPNKWIVSFNGKNVSINDLPPTQSKLLREITNKIKKDGLFEKIRKINDPKQPDIILKPTSVDVLDEKGNLLKSYKV